MISAEQMDSIVALIESGTVSAEDTAELRRRFDGLHFTFCLDDEMGCEAPYVSREHYNFYLVGGSEHCLSLTTVPEAANGVLIAEIEPD